MKNLIDDPAHFEIRKKMEKHLRELMEKYGASLVPSFGAG